MSKASTKDELDRLQRYYHVAWRAWADCDPREMEMERSLWLAYVSAKQAYDLARANADTSLGHSGQQLVPHA